MRNRLQVLFWITLLVAVTAVAANTAPGYHATAAKKKFTLVIDAGHGGHDAGAIGAITKEKIINLNVALAFGKLVERNCRDVKVIYTRTSDVFVPLHTRADIANRAKADIFISIHTNALPRKRIARGMETYTLGMHRASDNLDVAKRENSVILIEKDYKQRYQGFDPNSSESYIMFEFIQDHNMAQSVELAKAIQKNTCWRANRQNKGVKQAGFLVLRETSMPSCLVELGFISTPDEERFLNSKAGVQQLGQGIYEAFVEYYRQQTKGKVAEMPVVTPVEEKETVAVKEKEVTPPAPLPDESSKKSRRKKSKVAQELAEALEGSGPDTDTKKPVGIDADSILAAESEPAVVPLTTPTTTEPVKATEKEPEKPAVQENKPAVQENKPVQKQDVKPAESKGTIFKVQILASSSRVKMTDARLKGQKDVDSYQDGGMYKYTVGASENYQTIYQLRKSLVSRFPECFVVAFKDGRRVDVQQAISEWRRKR